MPRKCGLKAEERVEVVLALLRRGELSRVISLRGRPGAPCEAGR
jgi:hypothetical protein